MKSVSSVIGIESRGFMFGAALADKLGVGFIPVRKPGKLPAATYRAEYDLEYGSDAVEIHQDALSPATESSSSMTSSPPAAQPKPPSSWSNNAAPKSLPSSSSSTCSP